MHLEKFISDLLYRHDCVVIPEFGGLVANYRSARLNAQTHLISPPSKYIGFNRHLKNNDGLLILHLSQLLNVTYQEAQKIVDSTVKEWKFTLHQEGRIFLDKIGTFFNDQSGNLQFIPEEEVNYLLSSFGLRSVQLNPVMVSTKEEVVEAEIEKVQRLNPHRPMMIWRVAAAIAIPLLAAGVWLATSKLDMDNLNLASMNPFHTEKIVSQYSFEDKVSSILPQWEYAKSPLEEYLADNTNSEHKRFDFEQLTFTESGIMIARNVPSEVDNTAKAEGKNASEAKKKVYASGRFAVIGGAFADEDNALRLIEKLKADGFEAVIAGKSGPLTLVAYGLYNTKEEAQNALADIRSSSGGSGWIKRY